MSNASVEMDVMKAVKARQLLLRSAQRELDIQVVVDSNYYCPQDEGDLQKSALQSDFGSGVVEWNTAYARRQYYEAPNKSKDKNPNASMKWFERAKAVRKKIWLEIAGG